MTTDLPAQITKENTLFLRARFAGGRFDEHAIPFDVLVDLAAYRTLVVAVAKVLFKRRHPGRTRVPKGFDERFQLGLSGVEGGSSAVAIARRLAPKERTPQLVLETEDFPEFDEARDFISRIIRAVSDTGQVPADFPSEIAGYFNPFGQSLRQDEFVELSAGQAKPVQYNSRTRRQIVLSGESTYEDAIDATFTLNGGILDTSTLHLRDSENESYDFKPDNADDFMSAFTRAGQVVRLIGRGVYDRHDRLRKIVEAQIAEGEVEASKPDAGKRDFQVRLDEIAALPAGWYTDETPPPSAASITAMRRLGAQVVTQFSGVHFYPTEEAGVVAEWKEGPFEVSATIEAAADEAELYASDRKERYTEALSLRLDDHAIAAQLAALKSRLAR